MLALNILCSVAACVPIFWIGRRVGGVATGALAAWMWGAADGDHYSVSVGVGYVTGGATGGVDHGGDACTSGDVERVGLGRLRFAVGVRTDDESFAGGGAAVFYFCGRRCVRSVSDSAVADEGPVRWKHAAMALGIACCAAYRGRCAIIARCTRGCRCGTTLPLQLWLGNNNLYDPNYSGPVLANAAREDMRQYARVGEIAFMSAKGAEAREFISTHSGLYAELTWRRVLAFWTGLERPWSGFMEAESFGGAVGGGGECVYVGGDDLRAVGVVSTERGWTGGVLFAWVAAYPVVFYLTRTLLRYRNVIEAGDCGAGGSGDYGIF